MKYLNILVLAGLVVLYILFFVQKSNQSNTVAIPAAANYMKEGGLKIAFVNSDSIKEHYQLVMDLQKNLETKFAQYDGEISRKQQLLEQQAQDLQKKYESRQISAEDAQRADEQLQAEGRKVYELNQTYSNKMAEEESKLNKVFIDSIYNFLQRYNSNNTFDYILGYSKGGGILFAKDTLDITKEVIENLNKEYLNKYPEKK
jgi:outer membrane protein